MPTIENANPTASTNLFYNSERSLTLFVSPTILSTFGRLPQQSRNGGKEATK
jgi:hypothetical protein